MPCILMLEPKLWLSKYFSAKVDLHDVIAKRVFAAFCPCYTQQNYLKSPNYQSLVNCESLMPLTITFC